MNSHFKNSAAAYLNRAWLYAGIAVLLSVIPSHGASQDSVLTLFAADGDMNLQEWRIVNDGVMGGLSQSAIKEQSDGTLLFKGNVSLDNNGGFASTRSPAITADLGSYDGVELILTGDGNIYKCRLTTVNGSRSIAHQASFDTVAGEEQRIRIPFAAFDPTWRGQRLPESDRMDPAKIKEAGFLIADKQEGPFQLEVKSIGVYREDGQSAPVNGTDIISVAQAAGNFNTLLAAVEAAGLTDYIKSLEGVTLFAPTDEAFDKLEDGTVAALLESENKEQLINLLSYHVIDSEVTFSTATGLSRATALNEEELSIRVQQGALYLNDSRVIENDIATANGLIHVIDTVLLPPRAMQSDIPPVERIILSAIRRGVPQFNGGNPQACADIYELAAEALLTLPEENLSKPQRSQLAEALKKSQNQHSATDRAWTMRIVLDKTLESSDG